MRSRELERELRRVEALVREVARIEVDPERIAVPDRVERFARRHEVVGDLGRMHLEPEAHAFGVEDVHDRPPALGEVLVAALHRVVVVRRERVDEVPDRGAGEAVDLRHTELRGGTSRVLHSLRRPCPDALRLAVAVDVRRQDRLVTLVDAVADRLPDEMRADRPDAEPVLLEELASAVCVAAVGDRLLDLEVVAPAGELEAVEAPARAAGGKLGKREVGPLAGEQGDGTGHSALLRS